jgi:hypothetical protein
MSARASKSKRDDPKHNAPGAPVGLDSYTGPVGIGEIRQGGQERDNEITCRSTDRYNMLT